MKRNMLHLLPQLREKYGSGDWWDHLKVINHIRSNQNLPLVDRIEVAALLSLDEMREIWKREFDRSIRIDYNSPAARLGRILGLEEELEKHGNYQKSRQKYTICKGSETFRKV